MYKKPKLNTAVMESFCDSRSFNFHSSRIGSSSIATSLSIVDTEFAIHIPNWLTQCPGTSGYQSLATGSQVNRDKNVMQMTHWKFSQSTDVYWEGRTSISHLMTYQKNECADKVCPLPKVVNVENAIVHQYNTDLSPDKIPDVKDIGNDEELRDQNNCCGLKCVYIQSHPQLYHNIDK